MNANIPAGPLSDKWTSHKFNLNLVHIHGQNVGDKSFLDKSGNPTQIEMSFSHSKNIIENNPQVPHPLDQPGDFRYEEAKIYFEK